MKIKPLCLAVCVAALVSACGEKPAEPAPEITVKPPSPATVKVIDDSNMVPPKPAVDAPKDLAAVLAMQSEEMQARYGARHPKETLEFFGIEPGMTVVEALPGGGWYSKILLPYLGSSGKLIGVDYALDMYPLFNFYNDEQLKAKETWRETWLNDAAAWVVDDGAALDAFVFGTQPEAMAGTADAVVMIRALHNLARFEEQGGFLTTALSDAFTVLKPGGLVGVVQHEAAADADDAWADGSNGYLKKSAVIAHMESAGFEFVSESDINANPKDKAGLGDIVWRLPPSLATSRDNPELRAELEAIGESNRMTLLFRKPE